MQVAQKMNFIIVSGAGRNVGKTTFIGNLIETLSVQTKIVAVKISPHFHNETPLEGFTITEENSSTSPKDSSRMLKAGASRVFYIETKDEHLLEAIEKFSEFVPENSALIFESGGITKIYEPAIHFFLKNKNRKNTKQPTLTNNTIEVEFNTDGFNFDLNKIAFENAKWIINEHT